MHRRSGEPNRGLNQWLKKSKAMADQLTTVSKDRLLTRFGKLSTSDLENVERAIAVQLALFP